MRVFRFAQCVIGTTAFYFSSIATVSVSTDVYSADKLSGNRKAVDSQLVGIINEARDELKAANVSEREVQLRLKIIENVATVKSYFPHVIGGPPETRNSKYWVENDDGSCVPRGKPCEAIKEFWKTKSGIRCHKPSSLVMLKGLIDGSNAKQTTRLDEMLRGKVIHNDLPDEGVGMLFEIFDVQTLFIVASAAKNPYWQYNVTQLIIMSIRQSQLRIPSVNGKHR